MTAEHKILQIYSKLTKQKEKFNDLSIMKMYVCGPTLYNDMHIGNGRSLIIFDVFFRFFRQIFQQVIYVRNITDVDDKIINKAIENHQTPKEIVDFYEKIFKTDTKNLNLLEPTYEPKVTAFIPQIIEYIQKIISNGYGYVTEDGNVYFSTNKLDRYDFFQNASELIEESRICKKDDKHSWKDFALWKKVDDEFGYDSPWGYGRPSWHIECTVMSNYYLGSHFDFHGGGEDLAFPHHHNEIAQNYGGAQCCPTNLFVHNGLVNINGAKMSKSLGNIIQINQIVKNTYDGDVLRYIFISTYYSSPVNFSDELWNNGQNMVNKFRRYKFLYEHMRDNKNNELLIDAMFDDFNLPALFFQVNQVMKQKDKNSYNKVINTLELLGFVLDIRTQLSEENINKLVSERLTATKNGDSTRIKEIDDLLRKNFIQLYLNENKDLCWHYI